MCVDTPRWKWIFKLIFFSLKVEVFFWWKYVARVSITLCSDCMKICRPLFNCFSKKMQDLWQKVEPLFDNFWCNTVIWQGTICTVYLVKYKIDARVVKSCLWVLSTVQCFGAWEAFKFTNLLFQMDFLDLISCLTGTNTSNHCSPLPCWSECPFKHTVDIAACRWPVRLNLTAGDSFCTVC